MNLHPIIHATWRTVLFEAAIVGVFVITTATGLHVALAVWQEIML
jgi:hypothetical protein